MIGIGLLVCTGIYLSANIQKTRGTPSLPGIRPRRDRHSLCPAILVYPVLLHYLNFILATFAVVYFMLLTLKYKGPVSRDFVIALGSVVFSFVVFAMILGVSLSSRTCPRKSSSA